MVLLRALILGVTAVCAASTAGCGQGAAPDGSTTTPANLPRVDASRAGTLTGRAVLQGQAPADAAVSMSSDPYCMRGARGEAVVEHFVVGPDGGLRNVFVHVKSGLPPHAYDAPGQPVVLVQRGCRFDPHVFGLRVGQPVDIVNDDATAHNVHVTASVNDELNFSQPLKGMRRRHVFDQPEVMMAFKCDVHGWMSAYAGVIAHPYFAVTGADGRFAIPTLPPGTYVVEAWHEKLGTQTRQVTIGEKESRELTFTFSVS